MPTKSILVIDDSPIVRSKLKNLFESKGYEVYEAEDGNDALAISEDIKPDIITIDYQMNDLNGIETCKALKKNKDYETIPVIMLTSSVNDEIKNEAFEAGISEFIPKTSIQTILIEYIDKFFETKNSTETDATILVIDDSKVVGNIIKRLLMESGFEAHDFSTAEECLDYIRRGNPFDLILSDLHLPHMSGYEFIKKIRETYPIDEFPIIMVSGMTQEESIIEAFSNGANDYIKKPFQRDELLIRLRSHLNVSRLKKTLIAQNERLEKLNATKDEFLGIAAHDLRNPLTTLKQSIELLESGLCKDIATQDKVINIMKKEIVRMLTLLEDLLNLNKIESGKLTIEKTTTSLVNYIENIESFNELSAKKKNQTLIFENNIGDAQILIDEFKISQVINNYVSNAIKYSYPSSQITIRLSNPKPKVLKFEVEDHGQGIPAEEFNEVFKEFSRISTRPTSGESSTGLGLSICKKIVESHGGSVGFTSRVGYGSTFYFELDDCIQN